MKTSMMTLFAFLAAFLLLTGTQGCYTQLGSTRDEEVYSDDEPQASPDEGEYAEDDAAYEEDNSRGYGENWDSQVRFGFDYYYPYTYWPSVTFASAYNDPWYHWYGYDSWYSPYYSSWHHHRPWYSYYSYSGYGYGYGYYYPGYYYQNVAPLPRTNREFGSTRGTGGTRDPRGVNASDGIRGGQIGDPQHMDLPSGSGRVVTGGTSGGKASGAPGSVRTEDNTRTKGSARKAATRRTRGDAAPSRGSAASKDNSRIYRDRGAVSGSGKGGDSGPAPSVETKGSSTSGGSSRGGSSDKPATTRGSGSPGRSTAAPAATPPPQSNPPPAPASSGTSRSGGTRNPKP